LPVHFGKAVVLRPSAEKRELAECKVSFAAVSTQIGYHADTLNSINHDAHPAAVAVEILLLANGNLQDTMGHAAPSAQIAPSAPEVQELSFRIGAVLGTSPGLHPVVHSCHGVSSVALCSEEAPL
jgi:hypothetical protein